MRKQPPVIHPYLFALHSILFLYARNLGEVEFAAILRPLIIVLCVTALSFLILRARLKDDQIAGAILSWAVMLFFSYGSIYALLHGTRIPARHRYLLVVWVLIYLFGAWGIKKLKKYSKEITEGLNITAVSLIAFALFTMTSMGAFYLQANKLKSQGPANQPTPVSVANVKVGDPSSLPDIYYIIFDSYVSSKSLEKYWGFDNSEITRFLTGKGFYIGAMSHSNYLCTHYSMPATFNMRYLESFDGMLRSSYGVGEKDLGSYKDIKNNEVFRMNIAKSMLHGMLGDNSEVVKFLKARGYRFIDFSEWHGMSTSYKEGFFKNFSAFEEFLIRMTMLSARAHVWFPKGSASRMLNLIEQLKSVPDVKGPTFTYAHFMIPHDFLFDRNGNPAPIEWSIWAGSKEVKDVNMVKKLYLEQVLFANKKIQEITEAILAKSEAEPIIIFQGDHGAWNVPLATKTETRQLNSSIFNVYYFPKKNKRSLYASITPVNSFRVIFNQFLGADYPLLEDKSFYDNETYDFEWGEIPKEEGSHGKKR